MSEVVEYADKISVESKQSNVKTETLEKLFPTVMKFSDHKKKKKEEKKKIKGVSEEEAEEILAKAAEEDTRPSYLKRAIPVKSNYVPEASKEVTSEVTSAESPSVEIEAKEAKKIDNEGFADFDELFGINTGIEFQDFPQDEYSKANVEEDDLMDVDYNMTEVLSQTKYEILSRDIERFDLTYVEKLNEEEIFREKCWLNNIRKVLLDTISDTGISVGEKMSLVAKLGIVDDNMNMLVKAVG